MGEKKEGILVSVVIPIRNEEKYIDQFLKSVLKQDFPQKNIELIFIDGMSEDKTLDILKNYKKAYNFINIYTNCNKTVQYALNIGIENASGDIIVRMDVHSEYSEDYISKCVEYLNKTDAQNVGGPMIARGKIPIQKVVAAAYHSSFALGGGKFHEENFEGYADTVYLGAFKKETLLKLNMYDENLPRSEDDDLNFRLLESGGKVFITPKIKSIYYPRSTYKDLFRQYYEYGFWKVAVIKKHRKPARITHLIPALFVLFILFFGVLSCFSKPLRLFYLGVLSFYIFLNAYFSFRNKKVKSIKDKFRLMWVHFILHFAYGFGFVMGLFEFFIKRKILKRPS